jgi:pimeloyl-ACP methyl ester carboxylesterase
VGRRLLLALLAVAAYFAAAGQARAAFVLTPCKTGGVQCGTVDVPLDRSGATPGTISLHVEVLPAEGITRGVMFLVAGGPGQGSAQSFDLSPGFNRDVMRYMFPGYTLVAFDNRGTGDSGLINCPALQKALTGTAEFFAGLAGQCAATIGPQRAFYSTRDHADDTDAVRAALGVDRIGLYGVSYGTKLSLAYALGYPSHVERLILDSVVPTTFPDPFDRNVLREMPGTLAAFCGGSLCKAATPDYAGDVVKLANRLESKPIRGKIIAPNGKAKTLSMNGEQFLQMMIDADLSPGLAAEAPAAVRAALKRKTRALLRLYDLDLRSNDLTAKELSFGLNAATNCADGRFPWAPGTPPGARRSAIEAALAQQPISSFTPFGDWAARLGTAFFCEQWPSPAGNTPLGAGPLPNVPVLVLDGGFDLRTPVANALTVVNQFPQGQLIVVPGVGHSVGTSDFSGCTWNGVRSWINGTLRAPARAQCPRVAPLIKVLAAFPNRPARKSVATTLSLAGRAVREGEATWFQLPGSSSFTPRGLYGGKLVSGRGASFRLVRYSIAPGIAVTGRITLAKIGPPTTYKGTIVVSGPAAVAGTLHIAASGKVTGILGGSRVSGKY